MSGFLVRKRDRREKHVAVEGLELLPDATLDGVHTAFALPERREEALKSSRRRSRGLYGALGLDETGALRTFEDPPLRALLHDRG